MDFDKQLEEKLKKALTPSRLKLENESHKHNVPEGSHTHYKVTVVSEGFTSLTKVQRHQKIYQILQDELRGGLKALSIWALTPKEMEKFQEPFASPPCMGGDQN